MREKVILIKGFANISPRITLASFERINADNVVLITALRFPQFIPEHLNDFEPNLSKLQSNLMDLVKAWETEGLQHILSAEYANVVLDRGGKDVRAVEGNSLAAPWFYETIRNYHRYFGQTVVDCELADGFANINGEKLTLELLIDRYGPHPSLG